jgi:hypothetical protein
MTENNNNVTSNVKFATHFIINAFSIKLKQYV